MSEASEPADSSSSHPPDERNLYLALTSVIQLLLAAGLVLFVLRRNWENVFLTAVVILLTLVPAVLSRRYRVVIPPEFQLIAAAFVCLSLFLGSALDFYYHFCQRVSPGDHRFCRPVRAEPDRTMADLIVDTAGAVAVAFMGYAYLKTGRYSFIGDGVKAFVRRNPRLLGRAPPAGGE
jgi:hypothetical protein